MVKSIPTLEVDGVKERTRQWVEKAEASGLLKEKLPSAFDWLSFKMVCPLLKNGLCLVYDNRPFGCRSHNAIGDPALCHSAEGRKTQKYFNCPELEQMTMTTLLAASPLVDHLGVFLSEMLLNRPVPSAARQRFPFEFEKVSGPKNAAVLHLKFTGDAKS